MRAAQGVMLQRAGKGKKKEQRCAFRPGADAGRADGHGEHEKMHVKHALLEPLPHFFRREKTARQIRGRKGGNPECWRHHKRSQQAADTAENGGGELPHPFVRMMIICLLELDGARLDARERQVAPPPEFWRGRTGDAGNGGGVAFGMNGNSTALDFSKRLTARAAVILAREEGAAVFGVDGLCGGEFVRNALGELLHVSAPQGGHGYFLAGPVNGHGFQTRFLGQRIGHRPGDSIVRTRLPGGRDRSRRSHN